MIYFEMTPNDLQTEVDLRVFALFIAVVPLLDLLWQLRPGFSKSDVLPPNDGVPRPAIL
jgi:hypothetical protein